MPQHPSITRKRFSCYFDELLLTFSNNAEQNMLLQNMLNKYARCWLAAMNSEERLATGNVAPLCKNYLSKFGI